MIDGDGSWYFVRAYNMEPDGRDTKVKVGEPVAFEWIHDGRRSTVTRCVRLAHMALPDAWAAQDWPPAAGEWIPGKPLGKGGNGDVYRAANADGREVAVKYLHRMGREGYERFRAEIAVMERFRDTDGILPLVAHHLPGEPSREHPAWLATELATPLQKAPEVNSLPALVAAFAQIATTLSVFAEQGVSHRDIKPDNLFWRNDRALVGDFGLVDYPGKPDLTKANRKLGPAMYIAPEMLNDPHRSDGRPADVYSLAKSLWVLSTGQTFPIPGEQPERIVQTRLSSYVVHRGARSLDRLIAECTRFSPMLRPDMAAVAETLRQSRGNLLLRTPAVFDGGDTPGTL